MFIPNLFSFKCFFVLFIVNLLENIFEFSVVFLQNSVFGCQIQRICPVQGELEGTVGEFFNTLISVVHTHTNASFSLILEDLHFGLFSISSLEKNCKCARLIYFKIGGFVLVSKSVSTDDDRFFPSRNQSGDVFDDDRLSEDSSI